MQLFLEAQPLCNQRPFLHFELCNYLCRRCLSPLLKCLNVRLVSACIVEARKAKEAYLFVILLHLQSRSVPCTHYRDSSYGYRPDGPADRVHRCRHTTFGSSRGGRVHARQAQMSREREGRALHCCGGGRKQATASVYWSGKIMMMMVAKSIARSAVQGEDPFPSNHFYKVGVREAVGTMEVHPSVNCCRGFHLIVWGREICSARNAMFISRSTTQPSP